MVLVCEASGGTAAAADAQNLFFKLVDAHLSEAQEMLTAHHAALSASALEFVRSARLQAAATDTEIEDAWRLSAIEEAPPMDDIPTPPNVPWDEGIPITQVSAPCVDGRRARAGDRHLNNRRSLSHDFVETLKQDTSRSPSVQAFSKPASSRSTSFPDSSRSASREKPVGFLKSWMILEDTEADVNYLSEQGPSTPVSATNLGERVISVPLSIAEIPEREPRPSRQTAAVRSVFGGDVMTSKYYMRGVSSLKERVRANIAHHGKPSLTAADYYYSAGTWQAIARHQYFEHLTLMIIMFNGLWAWIETDYNAAESLTDAHWGIQLVEHTLCLFFLAEWLVRLLAFEDKRNCSKDSWFLFDSVLVAFTILDTWIMTLILLVLSNSSNKIGHPELFRLMRLIRITKVARVAKLLRRVPELLILLKGVAVAMRSVFLTLCLLAMVIYVFAVVFVQLTAGSKTGGLYYATVPDAMATLLLYGVFGEDMPDVVNAMGADTMLYPIVFFSFVLVATLTILNMLMGVLVEVVSNVAAQEKQSLAAEFVKEQLEQTWAELDENHDLEITRSEFVMILDKPRAAKALSDVGIDVVGLVDLADFIFRRGRHKLSFHDFTEAILQLRDSNMATTRDVVNLHRCLQNDFAQLESRVTTAIEGKTSQAISGVSTTLSTASHVN